MSAFASEAGQSRPSGRKVSVAIIAASLRYIGGQSAQADLLRRCWVEDPEVSASFIPIDPIFPKGLGWAERIPLLRTIIRQPLYFRELWRGLEHAEIAHVFSASYWSFLLAPVPAWWIARLRGRKTLIHYHSGEARDHLQKFASARRILRKVDAIVVPSQYLADVFKEFDLPTEIVANVAELDRFRFRERRPLRPHLICTRGFSPYYCVDMVIRAFAQVKKMYPDAQLDLVGSGPLETEMRGLVRQLALRDVNFIGPVPHSQIHTCYDQADIFINASRLDNMPVSILEAFAAGTPVVTTSPECMPYLIDHGRTGLLSQVGDSAALANNVITLLQDADLANRLAANARHASEQYNWSVIRGQWVSLYTKLVPSESGTHFVSDEPNILEEHLAHRPALTGNSESSGKL
jgi:L-malate glycosyltransferase